MPDDNKKSSDQSDGVVARKIKDSAKEIWLAGLGAFAKSERDKDEGLFSALVKQ